MRTIASSVAALALSACASASMQESAPDAEARRLLAVASEGRPSITLAAARHKILDARNALFKDPGSVQEAQISAPISCLDGLGNCVCLNVNARNSYGGYAGLKLLMVKLDSDPPELQELGESAKLACGTLVPFPELNGTHHRK